MYKDDLEHYRETCSSEIKRLLFGNLLNCEPFDLERSSIILDADHRSKAWTHQGLSFCSQTEQFCSLMEIDGTGTNIYNSDRYVEVLELHPLNYKQSDRLRIPFNHFQYPMMLDKGIGEAYDESLASLACNLDKYHDKDEILSHATPLVLYSYSLGGITKFGQRRYVYRFCNLNKEVMVDVIRRELVRAQYVAIEYLYKYPEFCRPDSPGVVIGIQDGITAMKDAVSSLMSVIMEKREMVQQRVLDNQIKTEKI